MLSQGKSHLCGEAKVLSEEIFIYPERSLNALLRVLDRSTCLTSKKERRNTGDTLLNDVEKYVSNSKIHRLIKNIKLKINNFNWRYQRFRSLSPSHLPQCLL